MFNRNNRSNNNGRAERQPGNRSSDELSQAAFSNRTQDDDSREFIDKLDDRVANSCIVGILATNLFCFSFAINESLSIIEEGKNEAKYRPDKIERPIDILHRLEARDGKHILVRASAEPVSEDVLPLTAIQDPELRKLVASTTSEPATFRKYKLNGDYGTLEVTTLNQALPADKQLLIRGFLHKDGAKEMKSKEEESGEIFLLNADSFLFDMSKYEPSSNSDSKSSRSLFGSHSYLRDF